MALSPVKSSQIKQAMAAKIRTVVGGTENYEKVNGFWTTPKVYSWNPLKPLGIEDRDKRTVLAEWAGLFTYTPNPEEPAIKKIHGWMIKRVDRSSELRSAGCEDFEWSYDVWGFYGYRLGDQVSNSEDEFDDVVDALCAEFNQESILTVQGYTIEHEGLQFPVLSQLRGGDQILHFAGGRIDFTFGD